METQKPIAIIGGGLAGLTAANYLNQHNVPFILFEAGDKLAGLAASFKDADGFSHDFAPFKLLPKRMTVVYKEKGSLLKGKSYSYP